MDISQYDVSKAAEAGVAVEIKHPVSGKVIIGDDDKPFTITVKGRDSKTFKKKDRAQTASRLQDARKKPDGIAEQAADFDGQERDEIELVAHCTTGWSDNWALEGEKIEFSEAAAIKLYTAQIWIMEQLRIAIRSRASFLKS